METTNNSVKRAFDDLFSELVDVLEEERELRAVAGSHVALIDVNDRLHTVRSELATARKQLVRVTSERPGEVTRPRPGPRTVHLSPGSNRGPVVKRTKAISLLRRPRVGRSRAGTSLRSV